MQKMGRGRCAVSKFSYLWLCLRYSRSIKSRFICFLFSLIRIFVLRPAVRLLNAGGRVCEPTSKFNNGMKRILCMAALAAAIVACGEAKKSAPGVELFDATAFQSEIDGKPVTLYTLQNANGMAVQITNYGARVVDLWVPSADGTFKDVIWGYETLDGYRTGDKYSSPIVGRYGNRIADGRFTLDGKEYQLTVNENGNQLHGGAGGFECRVWEGREFTDAAGNPAVALTYHSPDGEEGYPGNLDITVTYSLTPKNELVIDYKATTDAPTILNPTSHIYYNLHGTSAQSTDSHLLTIHASAFTPTDAELIPTGEIRPVEGTPLDFRQPTAIGARLGEMTYEPLVLANGYDHNWVLDKQTPGAVTLAAEVYEPATGIVMNVYTDQPGLQFYCGQGMNGKNVGKRGDTHNFRSGIALETQNFPDAPNHANFPSAVLRPGEEYTQHTVYAFGVKK